MKTKTQKEVQTTGLIFFQQWANMRGKNEQLESYEVPQLNEALAQFFAELRKGSEKEYEPDSLKVTQAALDRHLRSKNYPKSIVRDMEFLSSRKVLEGKGNEATRAWDAKTAEQSPKPG